MERAEQKYDAAAVGARIKEAYEKREWTQDDLAVQVADIMIEQSHGQIPLPNLPVTAKMISNRLHGRQEWSARQVAAIAQIFDCTVDHLLFGGESGAAEVKRLQRRIAILQDIYDQASKERQGYCDFWRKSEAEEQRLRDELKKAQNVIINQAHALHGKA